MSTIILSGNFADKSTFNHVINVPTAALVKPDSAKLLGFEFLMQQYPGSKVFGVKNFQARLAA